MNDVDCGHPGEETHACSFGGTCDCCISCTELCAEKHKRLYVKTRVALKAYDESGRKDQEELKRVRLAFLADLGDSDMARATAATASLDEIRSVL